MSILIFKSTWVLTFQMNLENYDFKKDLSLKLLEMDIGSFLMN